MIFKKRNPVPQIYRKRYTNEFEYMFVFSKGTVKTHNPIMIDCLHAGLELGTTTYKNYSKSDQVRKKIANPVKAQKIKGNVWEYVVGKNKEDQEAKGHPAPFPCELARDHILSWSNEGDIVLIETGADKYWGTNKYLPAQSGLGMDATEFIVNQGVRVIGIDGWGLDRPVAKMTEAYHSTHNKKALWPSHFFGRQREYLQVEK